MVDTCKTNWSTFLEKLKERVGEENFNEFFTGLQFSRLDKKNVLHVTVGHLGLRHTINQLWKAKMQSAAEEAFTNVAKVEIDVRAAGKREKFPDTPPPTPKKNRGVREYREHRKGKMLSVLPAADNFGGSMTSSYPNFAPQPEVGQTKPNKNSYSTSDGVLPEMAMSAIPGREINGHGVMPTGGDDVSIADIMRKVCQHYKIAKNELVSDRRSRYITVPRQVGMYLAHSLCEASLKQIGDAFGKDHTTVLHAVKMITAGVSANAKLKSDVNTLLSELNTNK